MKVNTTQITEETIVLIGFRTFSTGTEQSDVYQKQF